MRYYKDSMENPYHTNPFRILIHEGESYWLQDNLTSYRSLYKRLYLGPIGGSIEITKLRQNFSLGIL